MLFSGFSLTSVEGDDDDDIEDDEESPAPFPPPVCIGHAGGGAGADDGLFVAATGAPCAGFHGW